MRFWKFARSVAVVAIMYGLIASTTLALEIGFEIAGSDRDELGLIGPVHTVTANRTIWNQREGHWKVEVSPKASNMPPLATIQVFDSKGNFIAMGEPGGQLGNQCVQYDKEGHRIQQGWCEEGGFKYGHRDFGYNDRGQLVEKRYTFGSDQANGDVVAYHYDEAGRLSEIIQRRFNGDMVSRITYSYEVGGRQRQGISYLSTGTEGQRLRQTLNELGRVVLEEIFEAEGQLPSSETRYVYDGCGNPTEVTISHPSKQLLSKKNFTYSYDAYGNWISRISVTANASFLGKERPDQKELTLRIITYYSDMSGSFVSVGCLP